MPKFFIKKEQIENNKINIIGTDCNHIKNVLRLSKKEQIEICCPEIEKNYLCEIAEFNQDVISCNIIKQQDKQTEPNIKIHLFQGLPKADKMEWIIEKGTEIGISEFTPVEMSRSIVKLDEKSKIKKNQRWQKIAEVAAKQSGRNCIPTVNLSINIKNIYEKIENYDIVLVAYEKEEESTLKQILTQEKNRAINKIAIIVGPEGGFEQEEWQNLINHGAKSITIGPRILRTETAPLMIASNLIYEFEE